MITTTATSTCGSDGNEHCFAEVFPFRVALPRLALKPFVLQLLQRPTRSLDTTLWFA
jgi:hypothetical protein